MARTTKLKVYRTAIGFHDAYVAASSQKAALEAWGSSKDLFGRGVAEIVTDPELTAEPLASPGKVVKRLRGSADEQMAALPPDRPRRKAVATASSEKDTKPRRSSARRAQSKPPTPPPSRAKVEAAETARDAFETDARGRVADLEGREAALAKERKKLLEEINAERAKLASVLERETTTYDRAIRKWRAS